MTMNAGRSVAASGLHLTAVMIPPSPQSAAETFKIAMPKAGSLFMNQASVANYKPCCGYLTVLSTNVLSDSLTFPLASPLGQFLHLHHLLSILDTVSFLQVPTDIEECHS